MKVGRPPGMRRVVVKARISRHRTARMGAARAHLNYLRRDGVTPDGTEGRLYARDTDDADGKTFLSRSAGERHHFRLIVAAEDGAKLDSLKPFIRDLMRRMEQDLGTPLDWVAADHHNTGHPHSHVVIAGRDDHGRDLVIAKAYISHGIRSQAQQLITLELGPETQIERAGKLKAETQAKRLTALDRAILREARQGVWVYAPRVGEGPERRALQAGRLQVLARMGLAAERKPGVFQLDPDLAGKLDALGLREARYAILNRSLRQAGLDLPASRMRLWPDAKAQHQLEGRVLASGLADHAGDRAYIVIKTHGGEAVYAEFRSGPLAGIAPGNTVSLSASASPGLAIVAGLRAPGPSRSP